MGCTVVLQPKFDVDATFDAIEHERITLAQMVPAQLTMRLASPRWATADLSSLRMITTGSMVVSERLIRMVQARGIPLVQVYRSTETCPIAACLKPADTHARSDRPVRPRCTVRCESSMTADRTLHRVSPARSWCADRT